MSHKVHPLAYRLGINETWNSRWFRFKKYANNVVQDAAIRRHLTKKLRSGGVRIIEIERTVNSIVIIINTSRPGIIIGRAGSGVEELKKDVARILNKIDKNITVNNQIKIEVREIRNPEACASLVGLNIAEQLERRMPFRRVMKQALDRTMANKEVEGAKIVLAGRLGGADMARREWVADGNLPRNTLRSDIDFSRQEAYTTYGVIGIKVWIYKGQKLE